MSINILKIDLDSFEFDNQQIFGVIYFQVGNWCFPGNKWIDFVIGVLSGWAYELAVFLEEDIQEKELFFLDGDYNIQIKRITVSEANFLFSGGWIDSKGVSHRVQGNCINMQILDFGQNILDIGKLAFAKCKQEKWQNNDTCNLRKDLKRLKAAMNQMIHQKF